MLSVPAPSLRTPLSLPAKRGKRAANWALKPLRSCVFSVSAGVAAGTKPNFLPALRELGGAAALDAGVGAAVVVEELGELFEHDTAQLLGVDNGDGTAVIAGHVVADADRRHLDLAQ